MIRLKRTYFVEDCDIWQLIWSLLLLGILLASLLIDVVSRAHLLEDNLTLILAKCRLTIIICLHLSMLFPFGWFLQKHLFYGTKG